MITDAQLRPSENQSLAGAATTTTSTNTIDLLTGNANLGRGRVRRAVVKVTTAFTGGTSVQALLVQSDAADLSNSDTLGTGPAVADAAATVGVTLMDIAIPDNTKRYVGFKYVTVGTHTAGGVWAGIVSDTDRQPYLASQTGFGANVA